MTWIQFLRTHDVDHFHWKTGDQVDARPSHANSLVRQGIAKYIDDPNDQTGLQTTDINTLTKLNNIVSDANLVKQGDNWSGTQGSVVFVGANGGLDEDNDKLFFDDTNDELGINIGTDPLATLHVGRDISTGDMIKFIRSGSNSSADYVFIGPSGSRPDFMITGDGRVSIGQEESTTNARLRVQVDDGDTGIAAGLIVQNLDTSTGTFACAQFFHSAAGQDAVDIQANAITTNQTALDVQADGLTTGSIATFRSSSSSSANRQLVQVINDDASATGAIPFYVRDDADGTLIQLLKASSVIWEWETDGSWKQIPIADGNETDTAVNDDDTIKKLSLQRRPSAPTSADYIAFNNTRGAGDNFYLVLEDG